MRNLDPSRYVPYLLTSAEGRLFEAARQAGIQARIQEFPWLSRRRPWPYINSILILTRLIQRERIALVHTNCERSLTYVRRACQLAGTPYVCHFHDSERDWFTNSRREAVCRARKIIANSTSTAKYCIDHGMPDHLIDIIYSPIDVSSFVQQPSENRNKWRQNLGISENEVVFAIVGQIKPQKGQVDFIHASVRVFRENPFSRFLIIGDAHNEEQNKYLELVKREVLKSGLHNKVVFVGHVEEIASLMTAVDILVMASTHEAFGLVVVEGMAAGCAIIATNSGGPAEIITHEENGLLIPPGDIQAMASSMLKLANNPPLRRKLVENGRQRAWFFDTPQYIEQIQGIYSKILRSGDL